MKPKTSPEAGDTSSTVVPLAHNHTLSVDAARRQVIVETPDGVDVRIEITANGPVLKFDAPTVKIENTGDLCLEAENIALRSRGDMVHDVGGDYCLRAAGDYRAIVRDDAEINAQAISVNAQHGELSLRANDDVALNGLRILHNVPTEEEIIAKYEKVKTFGDYMSCPAVDPNSPRRLPKSKPLKREVW